GGSIGTVEREGPGLERWNRDPALRARHALGEEPLVAVNDRDEHEAARQLRRGPHALVEPLLDARAHEETIHDELDRVVPALVEDDLLVEETDLTVDAGALEARPREFLELFLELALAAAHDR